MLHTNKYFILKYFILLFEDETHHPKHFVFVFFFSIKEKF
jgi:hypothetical protein